MHYTQGLIDFPRYVLPYPFSAGSPFRRRSVAHLRPRSALFSSSLHLPTVNVLSTQFLRLMDTNIYGIYVQDLAACVAVFLATFAWIKIIRSLADSKFVDQGLARKIVHVTTGPLYVLTWLLFSSANGAQYLAALVPFLNAGRSVLSGIGLIEDKDFVKSMTRKGSSKELLYGPTFYALTLMAVTVLFWRSSWVSFVSVGILAGGDGMAEIVGRRIGRNKLPYNPDKSIQGSLAMIIFGFLFSTGLMTVFHWSGSLSLSWNDYRLPYFWSLLACIVCAFVESLPTTPPLDDNITVPLTAVTMTLLVEKVISIN